MPAVALRRTLVATFVLLLLAWALPASAQYRWKDSRGQLHASDQPPPRDIPDKDVLQRPPAASRSPAMAAAPAVVSGASGTAGTAGAYGGPGGPGPAAASAPRLAARPPVDAELQDRKARADLEAKARARADEQRLAAQRADNCQRARQHLATLETGSRLVRFNEKGERVVLDDNLRAQETAQARNVMASDCR